MFHNCPEYDLCKIYRDFIWGAGSSHEFPVRNVKIVNSSESHKSFIYNAIFHIREKCFR